MNKKQLTEEDIKLRFITPVIQAKWDTKNRRISPGEFFVGDGG